MTETQTVWMSNNQGVKEETFSQTSRRGRDRKPGWRGHLSRHSWRTRRARWKLTQQAVPHSLVDKQGGKLGSQTDHATQGSSSGKESLKTCD